MATQEEKGRSLVVTVLITLAIGVGSGYISLLSCFISTFISGIIGASVWMRRTNTPPRRALLTSILAGLIVAIGGVVGVRLSSSWIAGDIGLGDYLGEALIPSQFLTILAAFVYGYFKQRGAAINAKKPAAINISASPSDAPVQKRTKKTPAKAAEKPAASKKLCEPKPVKVNLGEIELSQLETIAEGDTDVAVAFTVPGSKGGSKGVSATVTPDIARQAVASRKHSDEGDALAADGEFQKATTEYKKAIKAAPYHDDVVYRSLGGVLIQQGKFAEAVRYLKMALEINPHDTVASQNLAYANARAGN